MKLTFLGATGTVTGSKYLVEDSGMRFLVDCGLFQGRKDLRLRNWSSPPLRPGSIQSVVLTHAHLDHSGYIPLLVKEGFRGRIYCSEATFDLCKILLPDSGHIQEEDADSANRHGYSRHAPALPLYTEEDARRCLQYFRPVPFGHPARLGEDMTFALHRAGHILGAAMVELRGGDGTSVLFSGDLGRPQDPVMKPPALIQDADYLVVESTYGDRLHDKGDPAEDIGHIVRRTIARGGTVLIPAFAVGRAQYILYCLYRLKKEGAIPRDLPVYLDSPMAIDASDLLIGHLNDHRLPRGLCAEVCGVAQYTRSTEESKALDGKIAMPKIIISASGMATGGRILHHLRNYLGDRRHTVVLAGFQAEGTRGWRLARGEKEIKFHGRLWPVEAEIAMLDNMSAHADRGEIMSWLGHFTSPPRKTFVTHGEPAAAESLRRLIEDRLGWNALVPRYMQEEEF
jgi:metallo-beta-lactamase family protein